jgi:hypothetical protein
MPLSRDLTSRRAIVAKGIAFAAIVALAAGMLIAESPSLRTATMVAVLIRAAARFYYFLFYVLETFVDPTQKYAGLGAMVAAWWRRRRG